MRYRSTIAVLLCACSTMPIAGGGPDADPGAGKEAGDCSESARCQGGAV